MRGLLKADITRMRKDKLVLIVCILALIFAAMTPVLYAVLFSSLQIDDILMVSGLITGKSQFFGAFSIGNNLGLIAPVLLAIALCKDFSYGTVRNKIIAGKSRTKIFLSLFATCSVMLVAVMMLYAFATLSVSLIFFEYQTTAFTLADFWYFLVSLALELLVLLWVAALLSCLCACMRNVGLVIVLYIAISLVLVIAGSVVQVALTVMEASGGKENLIKTLRFIHRINVGNAVSYIGVGTSYTGADILYLTLPALAGILGFTGLGVWRFNKKDLK